MKNAVESLEPTKVKLTVQVGPEEFGPALDRAYKEVAGQLTVPGFRPGKAPRRIIDARVGRARVIGQAVEDGLSGWFVAALKENSLNPLGRPEVDVTQPPEPTAANPSLEFTAVFEVPPEILIPDLAKVKVTVEPAEATEQDVDAAVDRLRERFASLAPVDRPAREGDYVTIDLKAEVGGEEVDSVSGVNHLIGSGGLLEGTDEALDGLSAGETTTFETALRGGEHAGETALVTVTVTAVKERELPAADDDWAAEASPFDTIEELREDVRRDTAEAKARLQVVQAQERLLDHLLESLDFPAPPGVVATEAAKIRSARPGARGDGEDDGADAASDADPVPADPAAEEAATAVRTQLLMDALAAKLRIEADESELVDFMLQQAARYGIEPSAFVSAARDSGEVPHFYAELIRTKALLKALQQIQVEDTAGEAVDVRSRLAPAAGGPAASAPDGAPQPVADGDAPGGGEPLVDEVAIDVEALAALAAVEEGTGDQD